MHNKRHSNKKWVPKGQPQWIPNNTQGQWVPNNMPGQWIPNNTQGQWMPNSAQPQWVPNNMQLQWIPNNTQGQWVPSQPQWVPYMPQQQWNPPPGWVYVGTENNRESKHKEKSIEEEIDNINDKVKDLSVSPSTPLIEDISDSTESPEMPQFIPRITRSKDSKKPQEPVDQHSKETSKKTQEPVIQASKKGQEPVVQGSKKPQEPTVLNLKDYIGHSWVRVSSDKQLQNCSSGLQRDLINKFCKENNLILCDKPSVNNKPGYTSCTNLSSSGWRLSADSVEYTTYYEPLTHIPRLCLVGLYVSRFCRTYSIGKSFEEAIRQNGGRLIFLFDGSETEGLTQDTSVRPAIDTSIPEQRAKYLELLRSAEHQMNEHSNRMKQVWAERKRTLSSRMETDEPQAKRRATVNSNAQDRLRTILQTQQSGSSLLRLKQWVKTGINGITDRIKFIQDFRALVNWTDHPEWMDKYYANPITIESNKLDIETIVTLLGAPPHGYAIMLPQGIDNTRTYWNSELLECLIRD